MSNYYGIDFGTTNCAIFSFDEEDNDLEKIGGEENGQNDGQPIPSVLVVKTLNNEIQVGREVKNRILQILDDERYIVFKSVKSTLDNDLVTDTETKKWNAEEVATELFKYLNQRVKKVIGKEMRQAVVAIPVGMNSKKRAVLRRAASRAGIEISTFISEPTAAFMSHSKELSSYQNVVVFDWGGGTLDISVLEHNNNIISERYTDNLMKAGDDIDLIIARWVHERISERYNLEISFESVFPVERQILLNQVEDAKKALQIEETNEHVIFLGKYAGEEIIEQTITKEVFNDLISGVVTEAIDLLFASIDKSKISPAEVGKILVVGGTGNLLLFREKLEQRWEYPNLLFPDDAEWDIAKGAVYLAANPGSYRVSENIGLELSDEKFYSLIPAFTSLKESENSVNLGLIEDADTATFIFATKDSESSPHRRVGELLIPCFGFRDEVIQLKSYITDDLILEAEAKNSHKQKKEDKRLFKYDKLRWQYKFENKEENLDNL